MKAEGPMAVDEPITVGGREYRMTCVSMGNPHAVVYVDDVDNLDLEDVGPLFENHERFPQKVNTEFVQVISPSEMRMRVWSGAPARRWPAVPGPAPWRWPAS